MSDVDYIDQEMDSALDQNDMERYSNSPRSDIRIPQGSEPSCTARPSVSYGPCIVGLPPSGRRLQGSA